MASNDIDTIIAALKERYPPILVKQLQVAHPGADDDGLWFFKHTDSRFVVQLESSQGVFPFVVETDRHPEVGSATNLAEAVSLIESWLGLPGQNR
jgi:hypothetical protein